MGLDEIIFRPSSIRLILPTASIQSFCIFPMIYRQAYLQSKKTHQKNLYQDKIQNLENFGLREDEILVLNMPLYEICYAGDNWSVNIDEHIINDLGLKPTIGDPSMQVKRKEGKLEGLMGTYVDDGLNAGDLALETLTESTLSKFDSKPRVHNLFAFFRTQLETLESGCFHMSQKYYATNINFVEKNYSIG